MVVKTGGGGTEEDGDQEMGTKKWGGSMCFVSYLLESVYTFC